MAQLDGLGLASQLKAINSRVNIIFVTGFSDYKDDAIALHASGYIQKPVTAKRLRRELDNLLYTVDPQGSGCYARTFGWFTFLEEGQAVRFSKAKSKELLAVLIDRRGAFLSRKELASLLWEGEAYSRSRQSQLSHVISALSEDLQRVGAQDILVKRGTSFAVDTRAFGCDLYDYLAHSGAVEFRGEYMEQYSWGEYTKGLLAQ